MVSSVGGMGGLDPTMMKEMRERMFSRLDANSDGSIDKTELTDAASTAGLSETETSQMVEQFMSDFDQDGDGAVTAGEAKTGFQAIASESKSVLLQAQEDTRRAELFEKLDGNGDGSIDADEFAAGAPPMRGGKGPDSADIFAKLDSDGDGSVTEEEFAAAPKPGGYGPPPPPPPPPGGGAGGVGGGADVTELFKSFDSDEDGSITEDEFAAGMKSQFGLVASSDEEATEADETTEETTSLSTGFDVESARQKMLSFLLDLQELPNAA